MEIIEKTIYFFNKILRNLRKKEERFSLLFWIIFFSFSQECVTSPNLLYCRVSGNGKVISAINGTATNGNVSPFK